MPRYIDADALMEYVEKTDWYSILRGNMTVGAENSEKAWYKAADIYAAIEIAPTIEARPVVRGEWIAEMIPSIWDDDYVDICYKCSECGMRSYGEPPHCPNCGAEMRTKEEE